MMTLRFSSRNIRKYINCISAHGLNHHECFCILDLQYVFHSGVEFHVFGFIDWVDMLRQGKSNHKPFSVGKSQTND